MLSLHAQSGRQQLIVFGRELGDLDRITLCDWPWMQTKPTLRRNRVGNARSQVKVRNRFTVCPAAGVYHPSSPALLQTADSAPARKSRV